MNLTNQLRLLAIFLLPMTAMAQEVLPLWPANSMPNVLASAQSTTITEKSTVGGGILRISDVVTPTLTVYPAKGQVAGIAPGSAVMVCPGGGYSILAAEHEGSDIAKWFSERGITAFVLKYRLPDTRLQQTPHEAPLSDAMQGMRLIRQQAARYNVDPNRIGVMGFSAGGHLAATLSTHYDKGAKADPMAKPNFSILMYPVITFGDKAHAGSRTKLLGTLATDPTWVEYYSNEKQVSAGTPPTFLVHSMDDKTVPVENSINYYLACLQQKVSAEMHLYPTGGHGFALRTKAGESVATWPAALESWLKQLPVRK
ncbi:alpha/beta hydrolase [Fibrivirga algicola]|uniref:Alpha/beta hydrolase n=1 Tax=Fibrivirga algicola TaxID=2950420 RepID=A0ABX0QKU5_9BACT|nr:alpha/beta hydrolase [Fibrivirga algicola]NID11647.1 alpha/beta hydrolase [Fibrivirga algicola]